MSRLGYMLLFLCFEHYCALHRNGVKPVFIAEQLLRSYSCQWTCPRCACNKEDSSWMPGTLSQWSTPWDMPRPISSILTVFLGLHITKGIHVVMVRWKHPFLKCYCFIVTNFLELFRPVRHILKQYLARLILFTQSLHNKIATSADAPFSERV